MNTRRWLCLSVAFAASQGAACASVLGIETLSSEPEDGAARSNGGGADGSSGGGGSASAGSDAASGGAAGLQNDAGPPDSSGGGVDAALDTRSDAPPDTQGDASDDAPIGSEGGPTSIVVTGTILDPWRHPFPGVPVTVGAKSTTTNSNGQFTFSDVHPPYDVSFVISRDSEGWLYHGIRRADPTFRVPGNVTNRSQTLNGDLTGGPFADNERLDVAFGSPDGTFDLDEEPPPAAVFSYLSARWTGPARTSGTVHALRWIPGVTPQFLSYDAQPVTLDEGMASSVTLHLGAGAAITNGAFTGTVTAGNVSSDRQNDVYIDFPTHASIPLSSESSLATPGFSYVTPHLPDATVSIVAMAGNPFSPPFVLAHKRGLALDAKDVILQLPDAPAIILPVDKAQVNANTVFQWSGPDLVYVTRFYFVGDLRFYVVGTDKSIKLPTFPGTGLAATPGSEGNFMVEIHGAYHTMDEATGSSGYLDLHSQFGEPDGLVEHDGSQARSEPRGIKLE